MVQGTLPELCWPRFTQQFLKAETTVRRKEGSKPSTVKAPFMPRVAMALDAWLLASRTTFSRDLKLEHATAAILLSYVFGWRASTVAALHVSDCTFQPDHDMFRFSEAFSKGSFSNERCFRILDL
jgi:hypothetical protein